MSLVKQFLQEKAVPWFISGIGLLLLTGLMVWAVFLFDGSFDVVLVHFILISIPGFVLLYAGYWLPKTSIRPDTYIQVAKWCIISIGITNGMLALLAVTGDTGSVVEVFEEILLVTGIGGIGGLGIGANQAKALTKANEAEEHNRELKRYETLIQESTNVNAVLNTWGVFQYLTPSAKNVLGYSPDELIGESVFSYIHPDDRPKVKEGFAETITGGEAGPVEFRFRNKDGSWVVLEGRGRNLLNDPDIRGIVAYTYDITERRKLEDKLKETVEKLEESNRELEQFAYAASHDLKEPLRTISGYLDLLQQEYSGELNADAQEMIDKATGGAERMQRMIDDLLGYSRITTQEKKFEEVEMNSILEQALENLKAKIEGSNAEINDEDLPKVHGDRVQLTKLFQNLIDNAIKYSDDERPRIDISFEEKNSEYIFSVRDYGIGIESEKQDEIFDAFKSLHTGDEKGTGIGLASVKKIVEGHNGDIWVESSPGEGTTFYFTVPKSSESDL